MTWGVAVAAAVGMATVASAPLVLDGNEDPAPTAGFDGRRLALPDLDVGPEPRHGFVVGTEWRRDGARVAIATKRGTAISEVFTMADGLLLATRDRFGSTHVSVVSEDGSLGPTWEVDGDTFFPSAVVSDDGRLGAFVQIGGRAVVVQDGGRTATELTAPEEAFDIGFAPVSVTGTDCTGTTADCVVLVHGLAAEGNDLTATTWTVRPSRSAAPGPPGIAEVRTVSSDGMVAGTVKVIQDGDGSCTGVADEAGTVLWTSCRDRISSFSPDSRHVLATTSAAFGSGDHELTVFDARTGTERMRLKTARNVGIYGMVWEDDDHVLAVVSEWTEDRSGEHADERWGILRIGLDGSREYAVQPVAGGKGSRGRLYLPER